MCHMRTIGSGFRQGLVLLTLLVLLGATTASAQTDVVMKVGGITGENCFDQNHQGWICVLGTSFTGANPCNVGSGCGAPFLGDFNVTKVYDSTSPQLLGKLLQGAPINTVEIEWWRNFGGNSIQVAEVLLETVNITTVSASSASTEQQQLESVSFLFSKITSTVWPITGQGTQGPPQTTCWNVAAKTPC